MKGGKSLKRLIVIRYTGMLDYAEVLVCILRLYLEEKAGDRNPDARDG